MRAWLEIVRPVNGLMAAFAVVLGALVSGASSGILPAAAAAFLISGAGMVINDVMDVEIDRRNNPERPLPSGRMGMKAAQIYASVLFLLGIAIAFFISPLLLLLASVNSLIEVLYAWRLKGTPFLGNVLVSWLVGSTYIFGGLLGSSLLTAALLGGVAFLANLGREVYKTVTDYGGDKEGGARTIAVVLGPGTSKRFGDLLAVLASAVSVLPYWLGLLGRVYMAVQAAAILVYLTALREDAEGAEKVTKYGMLMGLLAVALELILAGVP